MGDDRTQTNSMLPANMPAGRILPGKAETDSIPAKRSGVPAWIKGLLDLLMVLVLALLYNHNVLGGMVFHEIAGLAIGGVCLIHALFNARWIGAMIRRPFFRETPARQKVCFALDVLLAMLFLFIIISGLFINRTLLPGLSVGGRMLQSLHKTASYWAIVVAGLHIGLHWAWVMGLFRRLFRLHGAPASVRIWIARMLAVILFGWGVFAAYTEQFVQRLVPAAAFSFENGAPGGNWTMPADGWNPPDGWTPPDGATLPDGVVPPGGMTPPDGVAPSDGVTPSDGATPSDGVAPAEGVSPPEGQMPADGGFPQGGNGKGFRGGRGTPPVGDSFPGMRPDGRTMSGMRDGRFGDSGSATATVPSTLAIWLGIIAAFAVPTHHLAALLGRRRKRRATQQAPAA